MEFRWRTGLEFGAPQFVATDSISDEILTATDGGRVRNTSTMEGLRGRDAYVEPVAHLLDDAPEDAEDDAFPNLSGPALYAAIGTLCETSAERYADELPLAATVGGIDNELVDFSSATDASTGRAQVVDSESEGAGNLRCDGAG